jgi:hypothetical protein
VTLAAGYAAASWKVGYHSPAAEEGLPGLQYQTTRAISVPMIKDGSVQGYVVTQLVYTIDATTLKHLSVPPEVFLLDEAFRTIYSDTSLDFEHLEKYDINKLTRNLIQQVNTRLKGDLVKDVLVDEFNYVSKQDAQK